MLGISSKCQPNRSDARAFEGSMSFLECPVVRHRERHRDVRTGHVEMNDLHRGCNTRFARRCRWCHGGHRGGRRSLVDVSVRVVDASVMPVNPTTATTAAAVAMIGQGLRRSGWFQGGSMSMSATVVVSFGAEVTSVRSIGSANWSNRSAWRVDQVIKTRRHWRPPTRGGADPGPGPGACAVSPAKRQVRQPLRESCIRSRAP